MYVFLYHQRSNQRKDGVELGEGGVNQRVGQHVVALREIPLAEICP